MIFTGSRYTNIVASVYDGAVLFGNKPYFSFNKENSTVHTVRNGERLDLLAAKYYGDPQLFWVFVDANVDVLTDDDLIPGSSLIVPAYDEVMNYIIVK